MSVQILPSGSYTREKKRYLLTDVDDVLLDYFKGFNQFLEQTKEFKKSQNDKNLKDVFGSSTFDDFLFVLLNASKKIKFQNSPKQVFSLMIWNIMLWMQTILT